MSGSNVGAKTAKKSKTKEREDTEIDSHKDIEGFVQWIDEEDARQMAITDVYDENRGVGTTVNGWKVIRVDKDDSSGYLAKLYEKDGHFAYVTAGTQDAKDWIANGRQNFGYETRQYEQSIGYVKDLQKQYGSNLVFVGHSLGGGLASANSRATGIDAITFNSAALSDRYKNGGFPNSRIAAYINEGDLLDYANKNLLGGQKVEGTIIRRKVEESNSLSVPVPLIGAIMVINPGAGTSLAKYQINRGVSIHSSTKVIK